MDYASAFQGYFSRLDALYQEKLGTHPTVSWDETMEPSLIISEPDEDGEVQWRPIPAQSQVFPGLCEELCRFYSSMYYFPIGGKYFGVTFWFDGVENPETAMLRAKQAIDDGQYYFPDRQLVLLASCSGDANDDLLLFCDQTDGSLILYDQDTRMISELGFTLMQLISEMEAVL